MALRKIKKASVFIDLETLGNYDDAVILSMGLTVLTDDMMKKQGLTYSDMLKLTSEYKYNVLEQVKVHKRAVLQQTLDWWKKQEGPAALAAIKPSPDDHKIELLFDHMKSAIHQHSGLDILECRFWDRNAYDMKKLHHLSEVTLKRGPYPPWDYQEVYGIETLLRFMSPQENRYGSIPTDFNHPEFIYHKAGCDAALDAFRFYEMSQGR